MTAAAPSHSTTEALVASLDPEQRAAATLPDGPAQIIAPAGSGKTTTMVARIGVLLARAVPAASICVLTFNRDAAVDLADRVRRRLGATVGPGGLEIRTLHSLARQVLLSAGEGRGLVPDRLPLLRQARRAVADQREDALPEVSELDTWLSRWKVEREPPPPEADAVLAEYARLLSERQALDFDDLVLRACELLETDPAVRAAWQRRFTHVCVDEFQDVDAAQLRLVRLLAAPQENLFVVGDDDQTIYAWRLADVRRILLFADEYPAANRVMLATNYRCPSAVVHASARLIGHNRERFDKPIRPPPGAPWDPDAIVALDSTDPSWTDAVARLAADAARHGRTLCFLARTRGELTPVLLALIRAGVPHRSAAPLAVDARPVTALVEELANAPQADVPAFRALLALRRARGWSRGDPGADALGDEEQAALDALLGWATAYDDTAAFLADVAGARKRLAALRDATAPVELATVHSSKGREWETVVLVGFEAERIPNRRSLVDAEDPARAIEEERRLAYVALTRATRRLILAFDPARPSPFLDEMGYTPR
jgi:DNA helicase II / ATP-dependent DNA helicase PcrA